MSRLFFILFFNPAWWILNVSAQDESETSTPVSSETVAEFGLADTARQYQQRIDSLLAEGGAYNPELGEHLISLSQVYMEMGDYDEATSTMQRSLDIIRANYGLESPAQFGVLENLINANISARNWEELDKNYHLLLWLYRRHYEPGDPELLAAINTVGRWKVEAYRNRLLRERPIATINDVVRMYKKNIDTLEALYGTEDPRLIESLQGLADTGYLLFFRTLDTPVDQFTGTGSREKAVVSCYIIQTTSGPRQVCQTQYVPDPAYYASLQREKDRELNAQLLTIRTALLRVLEIYEANPSLPRDDYARALVDTADLLMLYTRSKQSAIETYQRAYHLLDENNSHAVIEDLFADPVQLPALDMRLPGVEAELEKGLDDSWVRVAMNVSTRGKPSKIEIVEQSDPEDKSARRRVKRDLRNSTFRPRFVDGEPVDAVQVEKIINAP